MRLKLFTVGLACLMLISCSKETVEPELFGTIEGEVINSKTNEPIGNVNITTSPPTSSIINNPDGTFTLEDIPTGQYSISADKSDYQTKSVQVKVREDEVTSATIPMSQDESSSQYLDAKVLRWSEAMQNDSTFAEVDYEVFNNSDGTSINVYEVYFDIHTSDGIFSKEVSDTSLAAGEKNIAGFRKYVKQSTIDSVVISGTWTSDD